MLGSIKTEYWLISAVTLSKYWALLKMLLVNKTIVSSLAYLMPWSNQQNNKASSAKQ